MKKFFQMGGVIAGAFLVLFGIGAIVIGFTGKAEVRDNIAREAIVGTPDMTPSTIKSEAAKAGLTNVDLPSCSVAGKTIDTGDEAKCFASYMRIHTLEATGGFTYSQMGRLAEKPGTPKSELAIGGGTNNPDWALVDLKTKQPVTNHARDIWVTETALTTALNTSFFAEQVSLFSIVIGIALMLVGFGLGILAFVAFRLVPQREAKRAPARTTAKPVTT